MGLEVTLPYGLIIISSLLMASMFVYVAYKVLTQIRKSLGEYMSLVEYLKGERVRIEEASPVDETMIKAVLINEGSLPIWNHNACDLIVDYITSKGNRRIVLLKYRGHPEGWMIANITMEGGEVLPRDYPIIYPAARALIIIKLKVPLALPASFKLCFVTRHGSKAVYAYSEG